jgi:hypothetical protein
MCDHISFFSVVLSGGLVSFVISSAIEKLEGAFDA